MDETCVKAEDVVDASRSSQLDLRIVRSSYLIGRPLTGNKGRFDRKMLIDVWLRSDLNLLE